MFHARVSTCSNTYKHLQAADLVSRGGRGRHAAQITPHDAVMLLFALIGSEHINDGPEASRRYSSLVAKMRNTSGSYSDERSDSETRWYAMEKIFPYLKSLDAGHTLSQAVVCLVNSYKDGAIPIAQPTIAVTIRGPEISANIRFDDRNGSEYIYYGPDSGRDMFRTIIGNPKNADVVFLTNYLQVEKRITAETLRAIGELLRDTP
jgi:hypothetical protein